MKKILLTLMMCMLASMVFGANNSTNVNIRNTQIKKIGGQATVSFEVDVNKFPSDYKVTLFPMIYNGEGKVQAMEPMVIVGHKRDLYDYRTGETNGDRRVVNKKQNTVRYISSVPFQDWMQLVSVSVGQVEEGCCSIKEQPTTEIMSAKLLYYDVKPHFNAKSLDYELTELEKYDLENPFLHPMEDYNKRYDILLKDRDKGTSKVIFKVGSSVIDMDFHGNGNTLDAIGKAFDLINNDPNAILKHIVIAGYASPEGPLSLNTRLGLARAEAVRNFIQPRMKNPSDEYFELINGREDWAGLRELVDKSNMDSKYEVLNIIDSYTMEQEERKTKLKQLNGGGPYKYMLENFYPSLRSGGYVQVYYEIDRRATVAAAVTDEFGRTTWVDPDSPRNRGVTAINKAIQLMVDGKFQEALDMMMEFEEDPRSWNYIGVCYMMKGEYDQADKYFLKAVSNGDEDAKKNLEQTGWAKKVGK